MDAPADDDPLRTMTVERVMRPDGRYLIYFDWPARDEEPRGTDAPAREQDDV